MTPERLRQLLGGESLEVEYKSERRGPFNDRDLVEAVVCLANRPGTGTGYLLLGVEDDRQVTGARPRHESGRRTDPLLVQTLIAHRTSPSLICRAEVVPVEEREVLVIEVPVSAVPVCTTDGTYTRRRLDRQGRPECVAFSYHDMQTQRADRGLLDYSAQVVPEARWEDLDPLEFERFRRNIRESVGVGDRALDELPDLELAKALGAVEANHEVRAIRILGLLLFGTPEALGKWIRPYEVAFQVLSPQVEVNDFFHWPLLRVIDEVLTRFRARNREDEIFAGFQRIGVPSYSEIAFREAVANALIHRDYTRLGAVHIQWWPDRIEISNPGGFPEGVRLDNLLDTTPRPRNPLLADAFKRAGIVERTARGIDTIFYEQLRNGRPEPDYGRTSSTNVVLVLPGGAADLAFVRRVVERGLAGERLGLPSLQAFWQEWQGAKAQSSPERLLEPTGEDGLIIISIGGESIRPTVEASLEELGLHPALVLVDFHSTEYVAPERRGWEAEARQIRNLVKSFVEDPRVSRLHLFYRGPVVLAPLLGALIAPVKPLIVYYYQDGGYRPAYTLNRRFLISRD